VEASTPRADVNIGESGSSATYIFQPGAVREPHEQGEGHGLAGPVDRARPATNTVTPSCMSSHQGPWQHERVGLIFMNGTGTLTEAGDGGVYKDLCRQCHTEGA